jgi:hypothetical protein
MMVAKIAQDRLNPKAKAEADRLLAISINPTTTTATTRDFVNAAHWADDVRGVFPNMAEFHFIDHPFSMDNTPLPADLPKQDNIVKALDDDVATLKSSGTVDTEKAQALRFVIHFVGDIHQPLHCATRVSSSLVEGDQGGNLFKISEVDSQGHVKAAKLHHYWDSGMETFPPTGAHFQPPPLGEVSTAAKDITDKFPETTLTVSTGTPFDYEKWAGESFAIAQTNVYTTLKAGKQPSASYNAAAIAIAQRRVALAGYRLAALLNAIWPESP